VAVQILSSLSPAVHHGTKKVSQEEGDCYARLKGVGNEKAKMQSYQTGTGWKIRILPFLFCFGTEWL
jgi:hypothetical protein